MWHQTRFKMKLVAVLTLLCWTFSCASLQINTSGEDIMSQVMPDTVGGLGIADEDEEASTTAPLAAGGRTASCGSGRARTPSLISTSQSQIACFLCQDPAGNSTLFMYRCHSFHKLCKQAVECHIKQLNLFGGGAKARQIDSQLQAEDPAAWRDMIWPLKMDQVGAKRPGAVLEQHMATMIRHGYTDNATVDGWELVQPRFVNFHKREEGCNADSASESFERRLEDSESEYCLTDDPSKPVVRVMKNTTLDSRRGTITQSTALKGPRGSGPGARVSPRVTQHSSQEPRRYSGSRGSGRDRHRDSGRDSPQHDRRSGLPSQQKTPEKSPGGGSAASVRTASKAKATPPLATTAAKETCSGKKRSNASVAQRPDPSKFRRIASSIDLDKDTKAADESEAVASNPGLAFIKKQKALSKDLSTSLKATTLMTYITAQLKETHDALPVEQQQILLRQGNVSELLGKIDDKIKVHKDLLEELKNLALDDLPCWEARKSQAAGELEIEVGRAKKLMDSASELKSQYEQSEKNAEHYKKQSIANKLEGAGCGKAFSWGVAGVWRKVEQGVETPIVGDAVTLNFREPFMWTRDSDRGVKVLDIVDDYQRKCKLQIPLLIEALQQLLDNNTAKDCAMAIVSNGVQDTDTLPSLKAALELPDQKLYLQEDGTSAWLATARPWKFLMGPSVLPLPGFGSLVQNKGQTPVALVLLPLKPAIDEGLVMVAELKAFLAQDAGGKLMAEHAQVFLLGGGEDNVVWCPYGYYPCMVGCDDKDKASHAWCMPVFSKHLACDCASDVWNPVSTLNLAVLQKHSGGNLWKNMIDAATKLIDMRASV